METSVDVESKMFSPYLPDEAQINPGVYGAELAFWLARQLAQCGTLTSYPQHEDWGWFIEYRTDDNHEYCLCCANRDGAQDKWRCYLEPKAKGLFGRNKAPAEGARPLIRALRDLLSKETGISFVTWPNGHGIVRRPGE
jgi:hypothetical protein